MLLKMLKFFGLDFTTKDHPGFYSLILYTNGCNFRCYGCHNRTLAGWDYKKYNEKKDITMINVENYHPQLSEEEVKMAIQNEFLDMIVLCGGEVLIHDVKEVIETIKWIKGLNPNVLIRIDTNGSFPEKVKYLKENKIVDGFAIDIKGPYWNTKYWDTISYIIGLPINVLEKMFPKILSSIHMADEMDYTLFRTVRYPTIEDSSYFEEIKDFATKKLKSPYSINLFVDV